jgi:hypothetical protein
MRTTLSKRIQSKKPISTPPKTSAQVIQTTEALQASLGCINLNSPYLTNWIRRIVSVSLKGCNFLLQLAGTGLDEPKHIEILLEANIDLYKFGTNAFLLAVRNNHPRLAERLVEASARAPDIALKAALFKS